MTGAAPDLRIVVYDAAEGGILEASWWTGSRVLSRLRSLRDGIPLVVIPAKSWDEACSRIESAVRRRRKAIGRDPVVDLQIWSHGYQGAPLIAGVPIRPARAEGPNYLPTLSGALQESDPESTVWLRACDTAEGTRGHEFMRDAVRALNRAVIAHCAVTSWPWPWQQREICALRPGEAPWWTLEGSELPSCSTFRMSVPTFAYRTTRPP